jgi:hypothetical protein
MLTIGIFLLAVLTDVVAQTTACTSEELKEQLQSDADVYHDAMTLAGTLRKHGISTKCVLGSTLEGSFVGQEGAATYRTDHGDFEVLFLAQPKTFDRLSVKEWRDGYGFSYSFNGPPKPWPANLIESSFPIYFIKDRNMLFVVQNNTKLATTLRTLVAR